MEEYDLNKKRIPAYERCFRILIWAFFIFASIVVLYPILRYISLSFSDVYTSVADRNFALKLIPSSINLKNWELVLFKNTNFRDAFIVSVERTVLGTLTSVPACALLSYILSRKRFMFRTVLSRFWVFTMFVSGGMIPTYVLYRKLNLTQSFWVYIIPGMVCVLHVLIMRSYMETIPDSLEESAQLDGAGYLRIFWSIISPLCKPVYAAVALFTAVNQWNSWFDVFFYNRMIPEYTTLQYELMKLLNESITMGSNSIHSSGPAPNRSGVIAVVSLLTIVPVIILYPFFQKHFLTAVTIRGVKK